MMAHTSNGKIPPVEGLTGAQIYDYRLIWRHGDGVQMKNSSQSSKTRKNTHRSETNSILITHDRLIKYNLKRANSLKPGYIFIILLALTYNKPRLP